MTNEEPKIDFTSLDPGKTDGGYWRRFQGRVVALARPELRRRGAAETVTFTEVIRDWAVTVVPAMAAAALAAGFLLWAGGQEVAIAELSVEEVINGGPEGASVPVVLDEERAVVSFAGLEF